MQPKNYLKVNKDKFITVTKGTYSSKIPIETFTGDRFIANINIFLQASGFIFVPASVDIYLGDLVGYFKVGANQNTLEKQYSVKINKKERSSTKPVYSVGSNLIIFVVATPILIKIPPFIEVPFGGCSLLQKVKLTNPPFDELKINLEYDAISFPQ